MRLALEEFAAQLRATSAESLPPVVLINGNEPLLIEEALDELRQILKPQGFTERLNYQVEAGFDWSELTSAGQAMSLFSERRLIELRVPKSLGAAGTRALAEYCNNPSLDDLLVVIMPLLDKRQRQAKWAKSVDSCGWIADCYEIGHQQFPHWLKQRLQSRALRVESGVVEMLAQQLEGNLLAAAQEIDKLQVLATDGAVTVKLLSESLSDHARFDVYALADTCLGGDFARALRIKQRLQSEGIEPVIVVWALVREIRTLTILSGAVAQGQNKAMLFKQHRIWSKREAIVNAALQRLPASAWLALVEQAAHLDQAVKGQRHQEAGTLWYQIEQLCAAMCGINVVKQVS